MSDAGPRDFDRRHGGTGDQGRRNACRGRGDEDAECAARGAGRHGQIDPRQGGRDACGGRPDPRVRVRRR